MIQKDIKVLQTAVFHLKTRIRSLFVSLTNTQPSGLTRVQIFDASGCYLSSEPDQRLQGPISVAVGPDDWVYVVENYSNRVSLFDECCKYVRSFGKKGKNDGEFDDPYAVGVPFFAEGVRCLPECCRPLRRSPCRLWG